MTRVAIVAAWEFHVHQLQDLEIISVICGVGKVSCASCTQLLISEFTPDELYMTGICGSLSDDVNGGDLVAATNTLQHDVTDAGINNDILDLYMGRAASVTAETELLHLFRSYASVIPDIVHYGTVVSGDQRIRNSQLRLSLQTKYKAIAVDQEIAAFSYVCYVNQKPFFSLKAVSDHANEKTVEEQKTYKLKASEKIWRMNCRCQRLYFPSPDRSCKWPSAKDTDRKICVQSLSVTRNGQGLR